MRVARPAPATCYFLALPAVSDGVWRICGQIGCCDSSPNQHASHHAMEHGHPIVTSVEPGENWSYRYVDEAMFVLTTDA